MSTDVRDHDCQGRVTRHRPDRRERSSVSRMKRGKSQKLNRKATPGRNRAAALFQRNMNCRQSRRDRGARRTPRKRGRQCRPRSAVNSRPQK